VGNQSEESAVKERHDVVGMMVLYITRPPPRQCRILKQVADGKRKLAAARHVRDGEEITLA